MGKAARTRTASDCLCSFSPATGIGVGIIPKTEIYAEQDNTLKSEFIRLCGRGIPWNFVSLEKSGVDGRNRLDTIVWTITELIILLFINQHIITREQKILYFVLEKLDFIK